MTIKHKTLVSQVERLSTRRSVAPKLHADQRGIYEKNLSGLDSYLQDPLCPLCMEAENLTTHVVGAGTDGIATSLGPLRN